MLGNSTSWSRAAVAGAPVSSFEVSRSISGILRGRAGPSWETLLRCRGGRPPVQSSAPGGERHLGGHQLRPLLLPLHGRGGLRRDARGIDATGGGEDPRDGRLAGGRQIDQVALSQGLGLQEPGAQRVVEGPRVERRRRRGGGRWRGGRGGAGDDVAGGGVAGAAGVSFALSAARRSAEKVSVYRVSRIVSRLASPCRLASIFCSTRRRRRAAASLRGSNSPFNFRNSSGREATAAAYGTLRCQGWLVLDAGSVGPSTTVVIRTELEDRFRRGAEGSRARRRSGVPLAGEPAGTCPWPALTRPACSPGRAGRTPGRRAGAPGRGRAGPTKRP